MAYRSTARSIAEQHNDTRHASLLVAYDAS